MPEILPVWHLAASRLYPLAKERAFKRKTLSYAEAALKLEDVPQSEMRKAAWPIHVWCWTRGMPPLNVVVLERGTKAEDEGGFAVNDYDVVHEALGHSVYTLEHAWVYPWAKVPDPTPEHLAWAAVVHATHFDVLRRFRFLDLEHELRLRDESRGRKRPTPSAYATWRSAEEALRDVAHHLKGVGISTQDLRPPGKGPYPPPRPAKGNWAD